VVFLISDANSLEIFEDQNNNLLHKQAESILDINKIFLKLKYEKNNVRANKTLLNNLQQKISEYERKF
jgi:hypothetical protein